MAGDKTEPKASDLEMSTVGAELHHIEYSLMVLGLLVEHHRRALLDVMARLEAEGKMDAPMPASVQPRRREEQPKC